MAIEESYYLIIYFSDFKCVIEENRAQRNFEKQDGLQSIVRSLDNSQH